MKTLLTIVVGIVIVALGQSDLPTSTVVGAIVLISAVAAPFLS